MENAFRSNVSARKLMTNDDPSRLFIPFLSFRLDVCVCVLAFFASVWILCSSFALLLLLQYFLYFQFYRIASMTTYSALMSAHKMPEKCTHTYKVTDSGREMEIHVKKGKSEIERNN